MKQFPRITDEHIVAYLDGELHVSPDFERELRADPALNQAADEYSAIGSAMARSRADSRFILSASFDKSTRKMLERGIAKSRKVVRTTESAPIAAPARGIPATRSIKFAWAKRASIGLAFASLLAFLWINFSGKNEQITQVPVGNGSRTSAPVPQSAPPMPEINIPQPGQLAAGTNVPTHPLNSSAHSIKNTESPKIIKDLASNVTDQNETPQASTNEAAKPDPADIMISHRYAKMIKATRSIEVSEQDRM
jgi:negative regulator of sigma E activity